MASDSSIRPPTILDGDAFVARAATRTANDKEFISRWLNELVGEPSDPNGAPMVILQFHSTSTLSSLMAAVLILLNKGLVDRGKKLALVVPEDATVVWEALTVTRLNKILKIHSTLDDVRP